MAEQQEALYRLFQFPRPENLSDRSATASAQTASGLALRLFSVSPAYLASMGHFSFRALIPNQKNQYFWGVNK